MSASFPRQKILLTIAISFTILSFVFAGQARLKRRAARRTLTAVFAGYFEVCKNIAARYNEFGIIK